MNTQGGPTPHPPVKVQNLCLNNFEYNANDAPKEPGGRDRFMWKVVCICNNTRQERLQRGSRREAGSQVWVMATTECPTAH